MACGTRSSTRKRAWDLEEAKAVVERAKQNTDPFLTVTPWAALYTRNGAKFHLQHYVGPKVPAGLITWALELVHSNIGHLYTDTWGWDRRAKEAELNHEDGRHIVVVGSTSGWCGYCHYRWEEYPPKDERSEEGAEEVGAICYIYELQLAPGAQRRGLGRHMMRLLETWAEMDGVQELMLTVFRANRGASALYAGLGYRRHHSSPDHSIADGCDDPLKRTAPTHLQAEEGTISFASELSLAAVKSCERSLQRQHSIAERESGTFQARCMLPPCNYHNSTKFGRCGISPAIP